MNILFFTHTMISIISLNWTVFTSDQGSFSVLTPGELEYGVKEISTSSGDVSLHNYAYHEQDSSEYVFLYSITHYDLQISEIHSDSTALIKDLFDETLNSISERIYGEILYTQDESFMEYPSRVSRVKYQDGKYSLKSKMILAKNKMFLIEVFSVYDSGADFKVRKFINSFKLIE